MTDMEIVTKLATMSKELKVTTSTLLGLIGDAKSLSVLKGVTSSFDDIAKSNKTTVEWGPVGTTEKASSPGCPWTEAVSIAKQGPLTAMEGKDGHTHVELQLTGEVTVSSVMNN